MGVAGILAGAGGCGKSYAALDLALSVIRGVPWLDCYGSPRDGFGALPVSQPAAGGRVVYVAGEDDGPELTRRLRAILAARPPGGGWPFDPSDLAAMADRLVVVPVPGESGVALVEREQGSGAWVHSDAARDLIALLSDLAADGGPPVVLVVVDPLARFMGPDAEADAGAATCAVGALEALAKVSGAAVLGVHHVRKSGRAGGPADVSDIRGHGALTDGARFALMLSRTMTGEGEPARTGAGLDCLSLAVVKSNYALFSPDRKLVRRPGGALTCEGDGERAPSPPPASTATTSKGSPRGGYDPVALANGARRRAAP